MDGGGASAATLVLGLGNPILGDDGVGWHVADAVEVRVADSGVVGDVEVDRLSLGGLRLMERLIGYDRAILVDAVETGTVPPGTVRCLRLDELPDPGRARLASAHDGSLAAALAVGRALGARLPDSPWVVAVEARLDTEFDDRLSAPIGMAVGAAVGQVMRLLAEVQAGPAGDQPGDVPGARDVGQAKGVGTCTS